MKKSILAVLGVLLCVCAFGAGEITVQAYLKAEKGARKVERTPGTLSVDWAGSRYYGPVIYNLTTNSWTSMSKGAVVTNGIVWMRNVGGNGSVKISFDAGTTTHLLIKTNEYFFFRLDTAFTATNIHFIAVQPSTNVITEDFEVTVLED
jgi:hypothetical protein